MPHKKTPTMTCLWHATHQPEIAGNQARYYDVFRYAHTCRSIHCPAYDQASKTCDPGSADRCKNCVQF